MQAQSVPHWTGHPVSLAHPGTAISFTLVKSVTGMVASLVSTLLLPLLPTPRFVLEVGLLLTYAYHLSETSHKHCFSQLQHGICVIYSEESV